MIIPDFGVRELGPALSPADSSAVAHLPRRVAASKSGDESPHSKKARFVRITTTSKGLSLLIFAFCTLPFDFLVRLYSPAILRA
jgi:hypothetical protein